VTVADIEAKGGFDVTTVYEYFDASPQSGKNYYRLKSVDYDLAFEYSPVVLVDFKSIKNVLVYPNPTVNGNLNVRSNFSPQEGDRIEIYNNMGLKLMEFDVIDYETALQFNASTKQGSYMLRYVSRAHTQVIRFNSH
jgi:hypothetical protein